MTPTEALKDVESRRDVILEFLEMLVNHESPSHSKTLVDQVGRMISERATQLGMNVEFDRQTDFGDNVVARLNPDQADHRPRVLMIGHMDTVYPEGAVAEWPFRIEGDVAHGPGVYDMKGGLVIGLTAVESALADADTWRTPITFIINGDEEPGSPKSRDVIRREAERHDLALILEPGQPGPALTVSRKGVAIYRMRIMGREAHAGVEPEKGVSSILDAALRIPDIVGLARPETGTSVNVGSIHGGTEPYVVAGTCELAIDVRVTSIEEQKRVEAGMEQITRDARVPEARVEMKGGFHRPPMTASDQSRALADRFKRIAAELQHDLTTTQSGGASDGNLTSAAGLPTIDGLGTQGGRAHSPDEYIEVDSLFWKSALLATFLTELNAG